MTQYSFKQFSFRLILLTFIALFSFNRSFSQQSTSNLGNLKSFISPYLKTDTKQSTLKTLTLALESKNTIQINITSNQSKANDYYLSGKIIGAKNSLFFIKGNSDAVNGKLINFSTKKAYVISTNTQKELIINKASIHSQVCVFDHNTDSEEKSDLKNIPQRPSSKAIPQLQSFPDAAGVIYLDFDGEQVSSGSWGTIDATHSNLTDEWIEEIFYAVSEDYAPFNINVTTDRNVYDNANKNSRQMVIFNNSYPNNPGVALLNSFTSGFGDPCFVKIGGPVQSAIKAANVGSHEAGHTFGLSHDGYPENAYYPGHDIWRAIMGTVTDGCSQFSIGEYEDANNQEDDLAILSGSRNRVGYRQDDHGNLTNDATALAIENETTIKESSNFGIIEKNTDVDVFSFEASKGTVSFTVRPANKYKFAQNLDIKIRLLDNTGNEIVTANGSGFESSTLSQEVEKGTYYLEIDGTGNGSIYTDYGSIGQYYISGTIPESNDTVEEEEEETVNEEEEEIVNEEEEDTTENEDNTNPAGVTVSPDKATLEIGDTIDLTATVTPSSATNKIVDWISDNRAVATVTYEGVVTAVGNGVAIITAITEIGGYTDTSVITVGNNDITEEDESEEEEDTDNDFVAEEDDSSDEDNITNAGVSVSPEKASLEIGETVSLIETVTPSNATNKFVYWISDNRAVATVTFEGVVTAVGNGVAIITAITEEGNYKDTSVITVGNGELIDNDGIEAMSFEENNFLLYPNPADNIININKNDETLVSYTIYSLGGSILINKKQDKNSQVNLSGLQSGIYVIEVKMLNSIYYRKIVKK